MAAWGMDNVQVGLNVGVLSVSGTWKPNEDERRAAWELYVELATRISVVPLKPSEGLLREALSSLYSLFDITRDILRRYGPAVARPRPEGEHSLGELAVLVLNYQLRPPLSRWHPMLDLWQTQRPDGRSQAGHEDFWEDASQL